MEINRFYTGNSEDIMSGFPDECIDLTITSPPYDSARTYNGYSFPFEDIARQLYRITKKNGVLVWVVGDMVIDKGESCSSFKQALFFTELGFKLHDTMIYEKNGCSFPARRDGNRYSQIFEYMFVFSKNGAPKTANLICDKPNKWAGFTNFGTAKIRNKEGELIPRVQKPVPEFSPRNNIWRYNTGKGYSTKDDIAFNHPATFPEKLAIDHIMSWSNEGDIIFDPMCGSGTVCKAAWITGRKFVGIDCSEEYINGICVPRLESYGWNNDNIEKIGE